MSTQFHSPTPKRVLQLSFLPASVLQDGPLYAMCALCVTTCVPQTHNHKAPFSWAHQLTSKMVTCLCLYSWGLKGRPGFRGREGTTPSLLLY